MTTLSKYQSLGTEGDGTLAETSLHAHVPKSCIAVKPGASWERAGERRQRDQEQLRRDVGLCTPFVPFAFLSCRAV